MLISLSELLSLVIMVSAITNVYTFKVFGYV
jgi:hypothetical protein